MVCDVSNERSAKLKIYLLHDFKELLTITTGVGNLFRN
jgi:hypothetical protein